MPTDRLIKWSHANPRKLFLIDGSGALLSAFLLGVVLVELETFFGIPRYTLYFLASLPCLFAAYDLYCYRKKSENIGIFLKGTAILNSAYCVISAGLAIYHCQELTYWGWSYIALEILIVMTLAGIEYNVAVRLPK